MTESENLRLSFARIFIALSATILVTACASARSRGEIRGQDYVSSDERVSIALPRPYSADGVGAYQIAEELSGEGAYYLMFGSNWLDTEQYAQFLKIIPKSVPVAAYRHSGRGEPTDAEIRALTLGVERGSLEKTFQKKSEILSDETISLSGRDVHYTVLVQENLTQIPDLTSLHPFNLYHGIYIFQTPKHTVLFRSTGVGSTSQIAEQFKARSFGRMQAMFESIKLLSVE